MAESNQSPSEEGSSCYAKLATQNSDKCKSETRKEDETAENDTHSKPNRELQIPVSFKNWKAELDASDLPEQDKKSFRITINWYLSYCKRARCRASKESANAFYESVKRERRPKQFQLVQWRNALRWFVRNAPAPSDDEELETSMMTEHCSRDGETWFDRFLDEIRRRHYSYQTERSYLRNIRSFADYYGGRDLDTLEDRHIRKYLDYLATDRRVSASTQRQALNSIVFLYKQALRRELGDFSDFLRANPRTSLPTVLSRSEVERLFSKMTEPHRLMAELQYGAGLRVSELAPAGEGLGF